LAGRAVYDRGLGLEAIVFEMALLYLRTGGIADIRMILCKAYVTKGEELLELNNNL
jgi:hypothetical protein